MTILQSDLINAARGQSFSTEGLIVLNEAYRPSAMKAGKRAFLSHSHLDQEMAIGLRKMLAKLGIKLYIDWLDLTMPAKTCATTARKIQDAINHCDYFLYLVTENSARSIWCPWELGFADGITRLKDKIYVVPTRGDNNVEHGKEYLGLYRALDIGKDANENKCFAYHASDVSGYYLFSV